MDSGNTGQVEIKTPENNSIANNNNAPAMQQQTNDVKIETNKNDDSKYQGEIDALRFVENMICKNLLKLKNDDFEYDYNIFSPSFIKNKQKCKYLGPDKHCTTENLSCKFFTCSYLKKYKNFNLRMEDYLLIMAFFNKKQQLILKHNFFHSKEELINKLLEKNSTPLSIYYLNNKYLI